MLSRLSAPIFFCNIPKFSPFLKRIGGQMIRKTVGNTLVNTLYRILLRLNHKKKQAQKDIHTDANHDAGVTT